MPHSSCWEHKHYTLADLDLKTIADTLHIVHAIKAMARI